jgi:hypothetical protein
MDKFGIRGRKGDKFGRNRVKADKLRIVKGKVERFGIKGRKVWF